MFCNLDSGAAPPTKRVKKRVRGKQGALKVVMTMPVDIIWEVRSPFTACFNLKNRLGELPSHSRFNLVDRTHLSDTVPNAN